MTTTIYTLLALTYLALQDRSARWLVLLKPLPILILAIWAWSAAGDGWLVAALLLSAAGDIALGLDGERYFVQGLTFFLLAHVVYVVIFGRNIALAPTAILPLLIIAALGIGLIPKLLPNLGQLKLPVMLYIAIIFLMGIAAALHTPFSALLAAGAVIFVISDASIAINKFVQPLPKRDFIVMTTYYLAQYLITVALIG